MQQCPDCAGGGVFGVGNGKCRKCYGGGKVGTIADDVAGGKLPCPLCHGTGKCQTCGGKGLVSGSTPPPERPHANAELNPFDDKVAVRVHCPKCGALDWYEWRFLGKLADPVCGHTWYAGSGFYTVMQIRAAFAAGGRFTRYLTSGISGEGAWIAKALGWFMGTTLGLAIRLEFGVAMIPIQALAGLFQAKKTTSDIVTRVVVLGVTLTGFGIGYYEMQHPTRSQFQVQPLLPPMLNTARFQRLLPAGARIIEAVDLTAIAGRSRAMTLWMMLPRQFVRRLAVNGCSEWVYGDYWYGPTRLSLVDEKANVLVNTITILSSAGADTFNIPFTVSNEYYFVSAPNARNEGQPSILRPRQYADRSAVIFPLFDYEACGQAATGAFGYSKIADRVMQFPIDVEATGKPPTVRMWVTQLFAQYPQTPGHWRFTWRPGHGWDGAITEDASFDPSRRRFVDHQTITNAP